jgi:hypothetical protein
MYGESASQNRWRTLVQHYAKAPTLSIASMAAFFFALTLCARGEPLLEEPTREVIQSGHCQVSMCADIDFGDYNFRYYAPDRTIRIRFIPKGACECQKIRRISGDYIRLGVKTRDGKTAPNVSLLRIYPPGHPRANRANTTTWERYTRTKNDFDEISDFQWDGDRFPSFHVLRSRYNRGRAAHDYFFVPRSDEFNFQGQRQPIAFNIPLGHPIYGNDGKISFTVGAKLSSPRAFISFSFSRRGWSSLTIG